MKSILFSEIKSLPRAEFSGPGIYIVWSGRGKALYVGRTQNIRSRLMQHRQIIELGNSGGITKFHARALRSKYVPLPSRIVIARWAWKFLRLRYPA